MSEIRFYFNLRSPYSWLATRRVVREGLHTVMIPLLQMPKALANRPPEINPLRAAYIGEDVNRILSDEGLQLRMPDPFDVKWLRPHAACMAAIEAGRGAAFAAALGDLRFLEGADVSDPAIVAAAAKTCDLDAGRITGAMEDADVRTRALGFGEDIERDQVFGVPMLVWQGRRYWGQDRIDRLIADMAKMNAA